MRHPVIPSAQLLIQYCKAAEICHIVISPGSRNAPLILGFTEDPYFKCYSIVDERSAAFFAIGLIQQTAHPVLVLCTSGSALLNYYPAVAEAFYSNYPLLIVSADRPSYKIDIGDGQTIRQAGVFDLHLGATINLKQDLTHSTEVIRASDPDMISSGNSLEENQEKVMVYNGNEIKKALKIAITDQLPVHINIPFEEPLYQLQSEPLTKAEPFTLPVRKAVTPNELSPFQGQWNSASRKLILIGVLPPSSIELECLDKLAKDPSVIIFTETTSNLHHPMLFPSIDSIMAPLEKSANSQALSKSLQPEILLTLGGMVVSKKIKAFLRKYKPAQHWHVHPNKANDTFFALTHHLKFNLSEFLKSFVPALSINDSDYRDQWLTVRDKYSKAREAYINNIEFSDFWVFDKLIKELPKKSVLHLANSTPIRYSQLFDMPSGVQVYCNRGTSGIDGSTSTAVGASLKAPSQTVLITGDLSFFYDANGLWNDYLRADFRIILINNGGGGIFRILPGKEESENFRKYFETIHDRSADALCQLNGLHYCLARDKEELRIELKSFYLESDRPKLLEIKTPAIVNDQILLGYFDFIS